MTMMTLRWRQRRLTDLVDVLRVGGSVQRCTAVPVSDADVGAAGEQCPYGGQLAVVGGQVQRRLALHILHTCTPKEYMKAKQCLLIYFYRPH